MEARWHGNNDRVHARVGYGFAVAGVAPLAAITASELLGSLTIPARVTADDLRLEAAKMATVHPCDEAAAQKSNMKSRHQA